MKATAELHSVLPFPAFFKSHCILNFIKIVFSHALLRSSTGNGLKGQQKERGFNPRQRFEGQGDRTVDSGVICWLLGWLSIPERARSPRRPSRWPLTRHCWGSSKAYRRVVPTEHGNLHTIISHKTRPRRKAPLYLSSYSPQKQALTEALMTNFPELLPESHGR